MAYLERREDDLSPSWAALPGRPGSTRTVTMRTVADRIRHTLSFEVIGLAIIIPLGAAFFHHPMEDIGVITVVSSIVATVWNYLYNWGFDHALKRLTGSVLKSLS